MWCFVSDCFCIFYYSLYCALFFVSELKVPVSWFRRLWTWWPGRRGWSICRRSIFCRKIWLSPVLTDTWDNWTLFHCRGHWHPAIEAGQWKLSCIPFMSARSMWRDVDGTFYICSLKVVVGYWLMRIVAFWVIVVTWLTYVQVTSFFR